MHDLGLEAKVRIDMTGRVGGWSEHRLMLVLLGCRPNDTVLVSFQWYLCNSSPFGWDVSEGIITIRAISSVGVVWTCHGGTCGSDMSKGMIPVKTVASVTVVMICHGRARWWNISQIIVPIETISPVTVMWFRNTRTCWWDIS